MSLPDCQGIINPTVLPDNTSGQPIEKYNNAQLLQLLSHYEAELQARDVALTVLKAERVCNIFKHGDDYIKSSSTTNPELALLRDSATLGNVAAIEELSSSYFLHNQAHFRQLEDVVCVQKACNKKTKQALNALEKKHSKILHEINLEKERAQCDTLKSDEFFLLIENERSKMQTQLDQKDEEIKALEKELKKCDGYLANERERERIIVLYLINERKQLLLKLNEMRMHLNSKNEIEDTPLVRELRNQVIMLNDERENLSNLVNTLKSEKEGLLRKILHLEDDLLLIQQNILYKTKEKSETLNRPNRLDSGGLIVANKGAFDSEKRRQSQQQYTSPQHHLTNQPQHLIQSSASFPSAYYPPGSGIPSSSGGATTKNSHSLQRPVSRPPQILKSTAPKNIVSGLTNPTTTNASVNHVNNNVVMPSNHSTVLLHRPSTRPPLGIKASNLPLSRNLSLQSTSNQPTNVPSSTNYRTTTIGTNHSTRRNHPPPSPSSSSILSTMIPADYNQQQVEYIVCDSRNPKALTKRSSSLPRNMVQNAQFNYIHIARNNNNHHNS